MTFFLAPFSILLLGMWTWHPRATLDPAEAAAPHCGREPHTGPGAPYDLVEALPVSGLDCLPPAVLQERNINIRLA